MLQNLNLQRCADRSFLHECNTHTPLPTVRLPRRKEQLPQPSAMRNIMEQDLGYCGPETVNLSSRCSTPVGGQVCGGEVDLL